MTSIPDAPAFCEETHRRIKLAVWAYAYEVVGTPAVPDAVFDAECARVDLSRSTGRPDLDLWWRQNFDPSTGMWVLGHPELDKVARLHMALTRYQRAYERRLLALFGDLLG